MTRWVGRAEEVSPGEPWPPERLDLVALEKHCSSTRRSTDTGGPAEFPGIIVVRKAGLFSVRSRAPPQVREETEIESDAVSPSAHTAVPGKRCCAFCQYSSPFREFLTNGVQPVPSLCLFFSPRSIMFLRLIPCLTSSWSVVVVECYYDIWV